MRQPGPFAVARTAAGGHRARSGPGSFRLVSTAGAPAEPDVPPGVDRRWSTVLDRRCGAVMRGPAHDRAASTVEHGRPT
ncbi:hypothetical protein ACH41E_30600, partial [Streptomyces sp. NPDC020412]|uniref:hypothetical protein n=1 Tax=Streptomyces sp. NPDC020412 TaxID=3365073 RepID=UPI003795FF14